MLPAARISHTGCSPTRLSVTCNANSTGHGVDRSLLTLHLHYLVFECSLTSVWHCARCPFSPWHIPQHTCVWHRCNANRVLNHPKPNSVIAVYPAPSVSMCVSSRMLCNCYVALGISPKFDFRLRAEAQSERSSR